MITPDHEILTESNGWVPVSNSSISTKIATLNMTTGKLEYQLPSAWPVQEVTDSDMIVIRHNRAELTCLPSTKVVARFSKTAEWQKLVTNNLRAVDFYLRLYLSEVVVKPINIKLQPATYSGTLYSPTVTNGVYLVRKNGKIFWVVC